MDTVTYRLNNILVAAPKNGFSVLDNLREQPSTMSGYDLDMVYVECNLCGKPVLWEKGNTSRLLRASGIDTSLLDAECMILSEGCPQCRPDESPYQLHVVRVASVQDILLFGEGKGRA